MKEFIHTKDLAHIEANFDEGIEQKIAINEVFEMTQGKQKKKRILGTLERIYNETQKKENLKDKDKKNELNAKAKVVFGTEDPDLNSQVSEFDSRASRENFWKEYELTHKIYDDNNDIKRSKSEQSILKASERHGGYFNKN